MLLEYSITGGYLKIPKKVFIQEMLSKNSRLRMLLNWRSVKDFTERHPQVHENSEDDVINIDFTGAPSVSLGESPKEILGELKKKYRNRIKGKVYCRCEYTTFGHTFYFQLDLNSDGGEMEYITD